MTMLIFALLFSILTTIWIIPIVGGIPGKHPSDFEPDYPGGALGLGWLITNVAVWAIAFIIEGR